MTAFIVISIKDSLHWIVDGIEKSSPQNPAVQTFVSTGKICKEERGHVYRFTIAKKERKEEGGVETFENLLNNQISQFRHLCGDENIKTNIFVLDNPMTDEDVETSRWIMQEIRVSDWRKNRRRAQKTSGRTYLFPRRHKSPI